MSLKIRLMLLGSIGFVLLLLLLNLLQMHWGDTFVVQAATQRVEQNIKGAWKVLEAEEKRLETLAALIAKSEALQSAQATGAQPGPDLRRLRDEWSLDILERVKTRPSGGPAQNPIAAELMRRFGGKRLSEGRFSGIVSIPPAIIERADKRFQARAHPGGEPIPALFMFSLAPIKNHDRASGDGIVAAICLSCADHLLEEIQSITYEDEFYEGKRVGTATIFSGKVRASTTVLLPSNENAVGTVVSDEVAQKVLEQGQPWTGRALVVDTWYLSRYEPIRDPDGNIIGILYVGELEELYLDQKHSMAITGSLVVIAVVLLVLFAGVVVYRQARRLAAVKKQVRFEFIRVLGHELKAPLNAVEAYLVLLKEQTLAEIPKVYHQPVARSLVRLQYMRKLITDLLDMTRIETGHRARELQPLDLIATAKTAIEGLNVEAEKRGITIDLSAAEPLDMHGDPTELSMLFNNLLSNAVKYNKDGGTVDIALRKKNKTVEIEVRDTGIGMTQDEVSKLFGEFVRIKNEKTRNILGSGLGLSILKKIVELYDGTIEVTSEPGVGTTFRVVLKTA